MASLVKGKSVYHIWKMEKSLFALQGTPAGVTPSGDARATTKSDFMDPRPVIPFIKSKQPNALMKKTFPYAIISTSLLLAARTVTAQTTLLSDNFTVDANQNNPNYEIANGRQGGSQATSLYTSSGNVQVGHTGVDFGQPGGAGNGNFLLLAQNAWAYNDLGLNDSLLNGGALSVSFNLYTGVYSGTSAGDWLSFAVGNFGASGNPWPTSNQFGLIVHQNGGLDVINGSSDVFSQGAGYVTGSAWTAVFSGAGGSGSPFDGTTQLSLYNGASLIDQFNLSSGLTSGDQVGFYAYGSMIGGVGDLSVVATPEPSTLALAGLGFSGLWFLRRRLSRCHH
jgi:hypothetical protein